MHDRAKRQFKSEVRQGFIEAMKYHFDNYWEEVENTKPQGTHYWKRFKDTNECLIDMFYYVKAVL